MANNLSVETAIEKNKIESGTPFLVCLEIGIWDENLAQVVETLRLVKNTEDITYQGNIFTAAEFTISSKSSAGELSTVNVSISDFKRVIQRELMQYGGGVGFNVAIIILNAGNLQQAPEHIEHFIINSTSSKDYVVTWTLGVENPLTGRCPKRIAWRDRCSWRFKSKECGYSGQKTSCDLTLQGQNGCTAHQNTKRFGGFPGIKAGAARYE